jgi:hypothetical protein
MVFVDEVRYRTEEPRQYMICTVNRGVQELHYVYCELLMATLA